MSTSKHTPYAVGGALTAAAMNVPLGQLDAAIVGLDGEVNTLQSDVAAVEVDILALQGDVGGVVSAPQPFLDARSYGVTADGVTNDTSALAAAIAAAGAAGLELRLPSGVIMVNRIDPTLPVTMSGSRSGGTILKLRPSGDSDIIRFTNVNGVTLRSITFNGDKASQPDATGRPEVGNGVRFQSCDNVVVEDCRFINCSGNGLAAYGGTRHWYSDCLFDNCRKNGLYGNSANGAVAGNELTYLMVTNCIASNNGHPYPPQTFDGFCLDVCSEVTFTNCISRDNSGTGFTAFGNKYGNSSDRITHVGCISKDNDLEGYGTSGALDVLWVGCISSTNGASNNPQRGNGWHIMDNAGPGSDETGSWPGQARMSRITMVGCHVIAPKQHGIMVGNVNTSLAGLTISGCTIQNPSAAGAGLYSGIFANDVQGLTIKDTSITDTRGTKLMKYAIETGANVTRVDISGGFHQDGTVGTYLNVVDITVPPLTTNVNSWAFTGLPGATTVRASGTAARTISGITVATASRRFTLVNVGGFNLTLLHDSTATPTAANRFLLPDFLNRVLLPNESVEVWYDNASSRWRVT